MPWSYQFNPGTNWHSHGWSSRSPLGCYVWSGVDPSYHRDQPPLEVIKQNHHRAASKEEWKIKSNKVSSLQIMSCLTVHVPITQALCPAFLWVPGNCTLLYSGLLDRKVSSMVLSCICAILAVCVGEELMACDQLQLPGNLQTVFWTVAELDGQREGRTHSHPTADFHRRVKTGQCLFLFMCVLGVWLRGLEFLGNMKEAQVQPSEAHHLPSEPPRVTNKHWDQRSSGVPPALAPTKTQN